MLFKKVFPELFQEIRVKFFRKNKVDLIILAGMGRSGTTWVGEIINHEKKAKILFEPFFPNKVKEAKQFKHIQYLNPNIKNDALASQALLILSGQIEANKWTDRDDLNDKSNSLIIKDIRCNLMLGWLQKIAKYPPTILVIRHPLQIVSSWRKLGWGNEALGTRSGLDIIISQKKLLIDFPIIKKVLKEINPENYIENIVFRWCIFHLVPLAHLKHNKTYFLYYENLINDYANEVSKIFKYLGKPYSLDALINMEIIPSKTNFNNRNFKNNKSSLVNGWKDEFSIDQIRKSSAIINSFNLGDLYDEDGNPKKLIK